MIIPGQFKDFKNLFTLNATSVLVLSNTLIFLVIFATYTLNSLDQKTYDLEKLSKVSEMYKQTLDPLELKTYNPKNLQVIYRDQRFWYRAEDFPFIGDKVEISHVRKFLTDLKDDYNSSPQFIYGLSPSATTPWAWMTYQFTHVQFFHFLSNTFFLLIVGCLLQKTVSSSWVFTAYIFGGLGGGLGYLIMNDASEIAVIGASGAICSLMAFLCVVKGGKSIEWTYFLSPAKNMFGVIYLPAVFIFPIYLLSDFTTVLQHQSGVQSAVAHSAHIGGALSGVFMGMYYLMERKLKSSLLESWRGYISLDEYKRLRTEFISEPDQVEDQSSDDKAS